MQAAARRSIVLAVVFIIGAPIAAILGWGYWQVSTHANIHVSLWDVALKTDRQLYGSLRAADVAFRADALARQREMSRGRAAAALALRRTMTDNTHQMSKTYGTIQAVVLCAFAVAFIVDGPWLLARNRPHSWPSPDV